MDATAHLRPDGLTNYVAEITGRLPVFWAGNLTAALAARNIDIVSGRGFTVNRVWTVSLVLSAARAAALPDPFDLIALAQIDSVPPVGPPKLSRFTCAPLPDGRLEVRVFAPDQAGFLSRLLRSMVLVALFLREFEIDTPNGQIEDRFILGPSSGPVTPAARQALERIFNEFTG